MRISTYKILLMGLCIGFCSNAFAQFTGVGNRNPHASALLDLDVTSLPTNGKKGFLPPRLNLLMNTDVVTVPSPAKGLWVYNLSNAGVGSLAVKSKLTYIWNGTIWDYFSSRDEILALKVPVDFTLSSITDTSTPSLTTTIVPISWNNGDILLANTDIIETSFPSTTIKIKKNGIYEFSGNIGYDPKITVEDNATTLVVALQLSAGGVGPWTTFASTQNTFGYGEVNTIQSIPFPTYLRTFTANDLVRLVVVKPSGTNHGSGAAIRTRLANYISKSFRITYIEQ
jgi:hypothetical protein